LLAINGLLLVASWAGAGAILYPLVFQSTELPPVLHDRTTSFTITNLTAT
jgi:hypothetical protein